MNFIRFTEIVNFATMTPGVIYEDHYVLIISKPSGMASEGPLDSAEMWCYDYVSRQVRQKNNFLQLMHRLDKPASGLLMFAKTKKAALILQEQIENRSIKKHYDCLVPGDARVLSGRIEHFLARDEKGYKSLVVSADHAKAQKAILEILSVQYNVDQNESRIVLQLHTGRYHQIRCQLNALGFPIKGDGLYAPERWTEYRHIALHAGWLCFEHPKSGENIEVSCGPEGW